jgi:hypothetical protein
MKLPETILSAILNILSILVSQNQWLAEISTLGRALETNFTNKNTWGRALEINFINKSTLGRALGTNFTKKNHIECWLILAWTKNIDTTTYKASCNKCILFNPAIKSIFVVNYSIWIFIQP